MSTRSKALVIAYDRLGERMAGPAVRSWELAHALADTADVTITSSDPIDRSSDAIKTHQYRTEGELARLVADSDLVLTQGLAVRRHACLRGCDAVLVVDMYDPWVLENLEMYATHTDGRASELLYSDAGVQNELVDHGDFFICASERQRDYWLGMLTSRLRLDRAAWKCDHELNSLIDVAPYGTPKAHPIARPALRGVHPEVTADDTIFLWSGGTWEWFDPLVVLEGFAAAQRQHPQMVLYFMGLGIKGRTPDMPVAQRLHRRAVELGLLGKRVIFGDWVPYDERDAHLLEADAAVLATRPSAESRLAFRSRILDHFWTGLPTLTTPGDALAELLDQRGAGQLIPYNSAAAWETAMLTIASDRERTDTMAAAAKSLASEFTWHDSAEPLRRVARDPSRWRAQREERLRLRVAANQPAVGMHAVVGPVSEPFYARGNFIDTLKRTNLYPFMRKVRRSRMGLRIWGEVPGEWVPPELPGESNDGAN